MEKAATTAADEVFLDLEDACAPLEKPAARGKVVEALRTHDWHGKARVVRINQVTSEYAFDDLREVVTGAGDFLDCIMVPKVRNAGDIAFVDRALLQLEQALGYEVGRIGIEAQIEDAEGLMRADEIAFSSDRLETLTYGPADFSASMQLPSLSKVISSVKAIAHPSVSPPWICPSTIIGLIRTPQSSTATMRRTLTWPVPRSMSTTTR